MGWRDDFIGQKFNCRYSGSHFYSQGLKIKFIPTRHYVSLQILMGVLDTKKLKV